MGEAQRKKEARKTAYVSFSAEINPTTTEGLLGLLGQLVNEKYECVHLLLSSPGGSVMNGINLYNVIRALPIDVTTHNVGNVDSIGNLVFLAGDTRYSNSRATFMFHGVGFDVTGKVRLEEKTLRERLGGLLSDQEKIGAVIEDRTTLKEGEIQKLFLEAVTRDPEYALANGIIHEVRDASVPKGAPFFQLVFKR